LKLGVDRIAAYRKPMTDRLKEELPKLGYTMVTPTESTAPIVTCVLENASRLKPALDAAKVKITLSRNRFRICTSVFNDMADIDRLLGALPKA
jgi:selenocysteine lyase/cysteine desulfurase